LIVIATKQVNLIGGPKKGKYHSFPAQNFSAHRGKKNKVKSPSLI
jgi:hypothetical protein